MDLHAGDVIDDKYEVVRLIGRGGMGVVYEGRHRRIHRRVAIKVLHAMLASDHAVVQRFEREAQAAGRIGSEHIVEVLDIGELAGGGRYMVMEFLEGRSLSARLALEGQLPVEHAFPIAAELLEGLGAAHAAGIVHRDLKPDNIWLARAVSGRGDFVKILDFGVSKFRVCEAEVTKTGVVVGTPSYMAPEQARADRDIDARADIYAVGVVLYRCLGGKLPFEGATYNELMFKVALEDPPPLDHICEGIDQEVAGIVQRALARERDERYPSAAAFHDTLVAWLRHGGFPVSLAVVDLLQSGDRIGAELLQSGEAWRRDRWSAPLSADAPTRAEPRSQVPRGDQAEPAEPAEFDGEAAVRVQDAFDGAQTTRQSPSRRGTRMPGETDMSLRLIETTDVLDTGALAEMSRPDDARAPIGVGHEEEDTLERPAHRPIPEMTTRLTAPVGTPGPTPRATRATVAVAVATTVLLVGLIAGISVASGEPRARAIMSLGIHAERAAACARRMVAQTDAPPVPENDHAEVDSVSEHSDEPRERLNIPPDATTSPH